MGKINVANISAGLGKVKSITESLDNLSHFEMVPLKSITAADHNPYAENDTSESLSELAESIKTNGLIHPIVVNKVANDIYKIISGERRFGAINNYLHWNNVPCMVYDNISMNAAALKLHAANLDVREYSTGEKLIFYQESERLLQSMQESGEYKGPLQKGIAELLGISTRQVRKYQAVMNLPTDMQHAVIDGKISINDACKSDSKSGTGSAFRENNKRRDEVVPEIDHTYWDRRIHTAIKRAYNILELYDYYVSCVPTPQEAIKEKLKPQYYRGGNVDFSDNLYGFYDVKPNKFLISSGKMQISLTYSQVDKYVREMIRQGTLISKEDISRIWAEKLK